MQFCKSCGAMLMESECSRCGTDTGSKVSLESSEKVEVAAEIAVVTEGENEINPRVEIECPKCSHKEAFFWSKQTRSSDEAETRFYKCTSCKYTWRIYR